MARETLAGVAAAGVGAGVVLALIAPARSQRSPLAPGFDIDVAAQRLAASAVWRF
jgi:hypothetical protein